MDMNPSVPNQQVVLALNGISKSFGLMRALSDVSLTIGAGEVHCLLGENGAGKSTLCNVIFGFLRPDQGSMAFCGQDFRPSDPMDCLAAGIGMVHQHFSLIESMSVVDNLMLGRVVGRLRRNEFAKKIIEVGDRYKLQINPSKIVADMSVGEKQRVEFLKCLIRNPRLLLLDEPTAVLPPADVESLLDVCRLVASKGCSVILVTHKLVEVSAIADRVTVLRGGSIVTSMPMADTTVPDLVRSMVGRDLQSLDETIVGSLGVSTEQVSSKAPKEGTNNVCALSLRDLDYQDEAGILRLKKINLAVQAGEIVGLAGVEGNGQGELADIIAGVIRPSRGQVHVAQRELTNAQPRAMAEAGVSVVPEDRQTEGCILAMNVAENLFLNDLNRFARFGFLNHGAMYSAAAVLMRDNDIRASGPQARMRSLSGGNQQKAVLTRELLRRPLVFLLAAQPTRGLDIGAVAAVYDRVRAARDEGAGVLLISSELTELLTVADRIVVIYRGELVGECQANPDQREAIGALMSGHVNMKAEAA